MTLISAIITDAYREFNQIALGKTPSDAQNTEALTRLQSLIAGVYGYDVGEGLEDWMVGAAGQADPDVGWMESDWQYPIQNSRILLNHESTQNIYLPVNPDNGARIRFVDVNSALATYPVTVYGNGRLINGAVTSTLNTAGNRTYVYNADQAEWQFIDDLALDDEMPFPAQFDDYFTIKLASRLSPRYGRSLSDLTLMRLGDQQQQLEATYRQTRPMPAPGAVRRLAGPSSRGYDPDGGRKGRWGWMN